MSLCLSCVKEPDNKKKRKSYIKVAILVEDGYAYIYKVTDEQYDRILEGDTSVAETEGIYLFSAETFNQ